MAPRINNNLNPGHDGINARDAVGRRMPAGFIPNDMTRAVSENMNAVDRLGEDRNWKLRGDYNLKKPELLYPPDDPQNPSYLETLKKVGPGVLQDYTNKKRDARVEKIKNNKFSEDYLNFINYPPR